MWKRIDSSNFSVLINILVSAAISVGIAVILLLVGQDTISSIIVALLTMIITILLEIMIRVRFSETLLTEMLDLYEDPWLFKTVKEMANGYRTTVKRVNNEVILNRARETLEESAREIAELASGHMRSKSELEETEILIKIIKNAQKEAFAVAHFEWFGTWWSRDIARKYMRENQKFIARGGKITRVFVVPEAKLGDAKKLIQSHQEHGVTVRIALREKQPESLISEAYLIVDHEIVSRTLYSLGGTITGSYVTTDMFEVREMESGFDLLLMNTQALDDFPELANENTR